MHTMTNHDFILYSRVLQSGSKDLTDVAVAATAVTTTEK